jgi:hypothetical protein
MPVRPDTVSRKAFAAIGGLSGHLLFSFFDTRWVSNRNNSLAEAYIETI